MEKSIPLMIHSYIELLHTKKHYSKHECVQGSQSTPELDQNLRPSTSEVTVLVLAIWLFMLTTVVVTYGNFFPLGVRAVMLVEKKVFKEDATDSYIKKKDEVGWVVLVFINEQRYDLEIFCHNWLFLCLMRLQQVQRDVQ